MGVILRAEAARFVRPGRTIFSDLAFSLAPGEVLAVLGPNGVGKTTLLRCLAGLDRVSSGVVTLDGADIARMPRRAIGQRVGLVPQSDAPAFSYSVQRMMEMGRVAHHGWLEAPGVADREIAGACLERLGIARLATRAYPELSGGERQLVLIARALAQQPRVLILDEPTAHLDFANQAHVLDLVHSLARQGHAVVLTTHDPAHAFRIASSVLLMSPDHPARFGATGDVLTEQNLSSAYGRPVGLASVGGRVVCLT